LLNRLRLGMDLRAASWLKFVFQAEDARVFGQNAQPAPASQKDSMDLRLGYLQLGGEGTLATLRTGRQSLDFGEGRLLADPNWSNVGRSFDAARLTVRHGSFKLDLFTGASVKIDPLNFDMPVPAEHFHGAYGSLSNVVPNSVIEPYVLWRLEHGYKNESGKPGNVDEKTAGVRWAGKLPAAFDYSAELAIQSGSWAGDRIAAWMGHGAIGYTLPNQNHKPRLFVEYNRASGDPNAKDGQRGTFDTLFAASHDKYGLTDLLCSSNVIHFRPGLQYAVRPGLSVAAAYNDSWLANPHDGLYLSGKIFARNLAAGTHVGQEADIQSQWSVSRATQLTAGFGRIFPGEFLQRATSGMPYNIVFLNVSQRF